MNKSINETRVILIGGSSHAGKSTLAQALAAELGWSYGSTDKRARHPGRPWLKYIFRGIDASYGIWRTAKMPILQNFWDIILIGIL